MKKFFLLIILLLFLFTTANSQLIDEPYDFPIKPGTPEWEQFSTRDEMLKAVQIPDDILKKLNTKALVETCLTYPLFDDILIYSSHRRAIEKIINDFNGFGELLLKQDVFTYLFEKYESLNPNAIGEDWSLLMKGRFALKFINMETLFFQDEIVKNMSYEEKMLLLKDSYSKYKKMLKDEEIYGIFSYESILYLMIKLLVAINEPNMLATINSSKEIGFFLEHMRISNYDTIRDIEILVNKVIQN